LGNGLLITIFEVFPSLFGIMFFLVFIIIILSVALNIYRSFRRPPNPAPEYSGSIVREREIIREIVKIRCPYCNNLYDEKLDKCPHCGGKKKA